MISFLLYMCLAATLPCCWSLHLHSYMDLCPLSIGALPGPDPAKATRCPLYKYGWVQKSSHQSHLVLKQLSHSCPWVSSLAAHFLHGFCLEQPQRSSLALGLSHAHNSLSTSPLEDYIDPFPLQWPALHFGGLESFSSVTETYYTLSYSLSSVIFLP